MYPKIGSQPTTDPYWVDKQLMNNQQPTADELKISGKQTEMLTKTLGTLNQTVKKGDIKAAQAQEAGLKAQFQDLSTEEKQYMYNVLNSKSGIADKFQYRLATAQRERLLKVLNPEHVSSPQATAKMRASEKASKTGELNAAGVSLQHELQGKL